MESEIETEADDSAAKPKSPPPMSRRPLIFALAVLLVAVGLIAFVQHNAVDSDHQVANFKSFMIGLIGFIVAASAMHRFAKQRGRRRLVPVLVVVSIALCAVLFRFDGFSGEMLPQIKPRFWGNVPLKRASLETVKPIGSQTLIKDPEFIALADSTQFLGPNRNGFIEERHFSNQSDAANVKVLWNQGIGEGWASFAVQGDRAVTLEQRENEEWVTCYRLGNGDLIWKVAHKARHQNALGGIGPRSTPTIADGRVYALGSTGMLWCIDLNSGDVVWDVDLLSLAGWDQLASETAITWGRANSPMVVDQLCVVPLGAPDSNMGEGRSLIAFESNSGKQVWRTGKGQVSYASPMIMSLAEQRQIVSVNEATVTGHRIEDGKTLWSFSWPGNSNAGANCASAVPAGKNRFLVGKGYGGGSALVEVSTSNEGKFNAEPIWKSNRVLKTKFTHPCVINGTAYALNDGSLQAVDLESEKRLWQQPRSDRAGQGQIMIVEDTIVVQTEPGGLVFVSADPKEYSVLFRLPALTSKTWNVPTLAGRHLLVRNDRQVICFLLPER